ncbi:SGNH/GDSL hydrolase family protein [Dyella sp. ASV21]|uniref:SGNH/GDSL hydrolase family protein n=1 Tax=Dyella sp. ASV21 TaxID=2795114 RepID=UPI0018EBD986|nr:SGNH/GDSL hydrolase family protein [Dyella sp. ASV21]
MLLKRLSWIGFLLGFSAAAPAMAGSPSAGAAPRVLIIGDSLSQGYTPYVARQLAGGATVTRIDENGQSSAYGAQWVDTWLGDTKWDVITFNFGQWDICYRNPDLPSEDNRDKVHGVIAVSPDPYRRNLERIVARLKQTKARLLWVSTTVVPEGEPCRKPEDAIRYNQIAKAVMDANDIATVDLYSPTARFEPSLFKRPHNVHYSAAGYQRLGEIVAQAIDAALPRSSARMTPGAGK